MNFEIRIFANPAGFEEMRLNMAGKYSLFSQEVVLRRNFDGERGQLPNGTFSVYYTSDAYIIAYHFLLSSDAQFRDREAHIAVAIQRGFKMLDPTATFQELASEFTRIAVEFKSSTADKIYNNSEKFYSIVSGRIVEDPTQFVFNTTYSVAKRAIIAVQSPKERDIILRDPFRKELKDIDILFIINYEDGPKVRHLTSTGYKPISNFKFSDSRSFILIYPDGHRVEFTDLDQEIPEYTIHRQYEKPLTFIGAVGPNMKNWRISVSEDKSEYIIGLQPEKEKMSYKVVAFDQSGREVRSFLISARIGQYRDGLWVLEGEEINRKNENDIFSIAGYSITPPLKWVDNSTLYIYASKIYQYDFSELFKFLKDSACQEDVTLHHKTTGQSSTIKKTKFPLNIPYSEVYVRVPETTTTEETNLQFDSLGRISLSALTKKKTGEIKVSFGSNFPTELKKKLNQYEKVGKIVYEYIIPRYKKPLKKEVIISSYPIIIPDLPLLPVSVKIDIEGYKVFQDEVNLQNNPNSEVQCDLIPTSATRIKRYCKKHLPTFVVGIILGILLGFLIANKMSDYLPSNQDKSDQIDALTKNNSELSKENRELKNRIGGLEEQLQGVHDDKADSVIVEAVSDSDKAGRHGLTDEQNTMIEKLRGKEFTLDDVNQAKEILKGSGQDALIKDASACLCILNLGKSDKEKLLTPGSSAYNLHYKNLGCHKELMDGIIASESYMSATNRNFITIKQMEEYINVNK